MITTGLSKCYNLIVAILDIAPNLTSSNSTFPNGIDLEIDNILPESLNEIDGNVDILKEHLSNDGK